MPTTMSTATSHQRASASLPASLKAISTEPRAMTSGATPTQSMGWVTAALVSPVRRNTAMTATAQIKAITQKMLRKP